MKLQKTKEIGRPDIVFCLARVPETGRLYFGSSDFKVYEIDADAEKPEPQAFSGEGHQSYVTGMALAGGSLVSGSYDGRLIWWDAEARRQVRAIEAHERWIRRVIASPDGSTVVSVADDMVCKLWNAETGELLRTVSDHEPITPNHYPSMLYAVTVSADGRLLATGDKVGHVAVWDFQSGEQLAQFEAPVMYTWDPKARRHSIGGIRSLQFSPDAKLLVVGGIGKIGNIDHLGGPARVEVFDWEAGTRKHELEDEKLKGLVEHIAFHSSGEWFLTAGGDHGGFLTVYNTESGKITQQEKVPTHVHGVAFNESQEKLYVVGHQKITVWELTA